MAVEPLQHRGMRDLDLNSSSVAVEPLPPRGSMYLGLNNSSEAVEPLQQRGVRDLDLNSSSKQYCIAHGGDRRCQQEGCSKSVAKAPGSTLCTL